MATGYPDWTRAIRLLGVDADGNLITILTDNAGRLYSLIMGQDGDGVRRAVAVDTDGQMVMVPRGESGNYMEVDSDGFLTTVLKGLLNGTLTTVAVDSQGYLAAYMLDDESQWGDVIKCGNAELAARLNSPLAWDWRGKVQIIHTFENGMESLKTTIGENGAAIALDPTRHQSGGYSLKMTSGSLINFNLITVEGFAGVSPSSKYGLSICFALDGAIDYLTVLVARFDGTNDHNGSIRYDYDGGKLQVLDDVSGWTDFATVAPYATEYVFHRMKVVVDVDTDTYVRALFDGTEYDLSAYALSVGAVATADHLRYYCNLTGHVGENEIAYLDSMIVTAAEP